MDPVEIPIGNGFYVSESLPISAQQCKNFFPNYPESDAISRSQLFPTPGIKSLIETGETEINRGGHVMAGIAYFVNGNTLYKISRTFDAFGDPVYSSESKGTITGSGRVSMSDNGTQLCIVVPGTATAYIYTEAGGLAQITDPDFIPSPIASIVNQVVFIDGYFVFAADNSVFFHSDLNDGTSYVATDFGQYDDAKKDIVGMHVYKSQLYVFGETSGKAYSNEGGSGFVFQEIPGYAFSKGLASRFSIADTGGTFAMIGQGLNESPKIYVFTGNDFSAISTTAIETSLQSYNDEEIALAFSFSYSFRGAEFAGWSLPRDTFVFDGKASALAERKIWHQRESSELQGKTRWRVNSLLTAYGVLLCGDSEGGKIGELDYDTRTEYGNLIIREFSLPVIENNSRSVFHRLLELVLESGEGYGGGAATVSMDYSNDAKNYTYERFRQCGELGQYSTKVRWYNLGSTRRLRVYRFKFSEPVKWIIYKVLLTTDA